jgi:hypothetical protein
VIHNKPRMRAVLSAALGLACLPKGFTVGQLVDTVRSTRGATTSNYDARRSLTAFGSYAATSWSAGLPTPADTAFRRKRSARLRRW